VGVVDVRQRLHLGVSTGWTALGVLLAVYEWAVLIDGVTVPDARFLWSHATALDVLGEGVLSLAWRCD